jgi:putative hydrolase of the HAD superfamily
VGLAPYFQGAISARAFGLAKPAPQIYAAVAEHLSVPMDAVLHVGDDPELDVAGALAAGQHAAWVNREARSWPNGLPAPSLQVRDMGELARVLLG